MHINRVEVGVYNVTQFGHVTGMSLEVFLAVQLTIQYIWK